MAEPGQAGGERPFDLVLLGATGFAGGLTAEYLARHVPSGCRWALAGRNREKLEGVRDRLAAVDPAWVDLPLLTADVEDAESMQRLAGITRVVLSTVGPYLAHGEPLVAACAEAGTDYCDLTGEPEFVDRMYLAHHARAVETGARLVHACGFDCVPADLGALFTIQQLPEGVPVRMRGLVSADAAPSGGTLHSAVAALTRGPQASAAASRRRAGEQRPVGRRVGSIRRGPHHDAEAGAWLLPLPTLDSHVVRRSAVALERYGPDFRYGHYAAFRRLPAALLGLTGVAALGGAVQVPPLRRLILARLPQGQGPSEERRTRSTFTVRFLAEGGGTTVRTEVSGGDPGYTETAKMLSESALCLAFDDNPPSAGQVTTAVAMGENLVARLRRRGLDFRVTPHASD